MNNGTGTLGAEWPTMPMDRLYTLAAIMTVALIGNCIIVVTLTCTRYGAVVGGGQTFSRRVSMFIMNLAVSDLAVCLITIPGEMVFTVFGEWMLGAVACKLLVYGQIVALAGTIFNLSAMSYDRYLAVCQPLRFRNNVSRARRTIAVAWSLAFLLSVPQLFIFVQVRRASATHDDGTPVYDCASQGYTAWWQRRVYFSCLTLCILVLPAALITFCYVSIVRVVWRQGRLETVVVEMSRMPSASSTSSSLARGSKLSLRKSVNSDRRQSSRAKVRTIKLTLCIILTFVTCWSPYFVINNIRIHSHYEAPIPASVRVMAETVGLVNSALNPIIYFCFNLRMKKALQSIHCSCCNVSRCFCGDDDDDVHGGRQGGCGDCGRERCRQRRRRPRFYAGMGSVLRNAVVVNFQSNNATSDFSSSCADDLTTVVQVSGSVKAVDSCSTTPSSFRTATTARSSAAVLEDLMPPSVSRQNCSPTIFDNANDNDVRVTHDDPVSCELMS